MSWISVEDRLPTEGELVLVYKKDSISGLPVFDIGYLDNDEVLIWSCYNGQSITHWQPLPDPPTS